jgi:hypothetical protein
VPGPRAFDREMAIEKQKDAKHQVLIKSRQNCFKAGCRTIRFDVHIGINSVWNKEKLPEE